MGKITVCYDDLEQKVEIEDNKLIVPEGVKFVYCDDNKLKELIIPEGVEWVSCKNNKLTELALPESVKYVYCDNNKLKELILPKGVKYVYCDNNKLKELILPEGIEYVYCDKGVKKVESGGGGMKAANEILAELVALKHIKDTQGKTPEYLERQLKAWEKAKKYLATALG
jgi:rRNA-processing protein FCF1